MYNTPFDSLTFKHFINSKCYLVYNVSIQCWIGAHLLRLHKWCNFSFLLALHSELHFLTHFFYHNNSSLLFLILSIEIAFFSHFDSFCSIAHFHKEFSFSKWFFLCFLMFCLNVRLKILKQVRSVDFNLFPCFSRMLLQILWVHLG